MMFTVSVVAVSFLFLRRGVFPCSGRKKGCHGFVIFAGYFIGVGRRQLVGTAPVFPAMIVVFFRQ
jgi:hypothetical protein